MKQVFRYCFLIAVIFFPSIAWAQVLVSETDFSGLKSASDDPVALGTTLPDYPDWEFMRCYKIKVGGLFVGDSNNPGSFTSAPLGIEGNANIILEVKRSSSGNATIEATLSGGGTLSSVVSKTIDKSSYYHIVYYVKDGTPFTRLTITGTAGKFYVNNMRVYNIGDVVFYESFDHMDGRNKENEFYSSNKDATLAMCDNSENTSIVGIRSSYRSIYLEDSSSEYQILQAPVEENSIVLLSFQIGYPSFMNNQRLTLSCSSDAYVTQLNSTDQNTLFTSVEKTQFSDPYRNWYDYFV